MRQVFIVAGLLLGAALLPGAPAKAAAGCQCVKLGAPSICTATVADCNFNYPWHLRGAMHLRAAEEVSETSAV